MLKGRNWRLMFYSIFLVLPPQRLKNLGPQYLNQSWHHCSQAWLSNPLLREAECTDGSAEASDCSWRTKCCWPMLLPQPPLRPWQVIWVVEGDLGLACFSAGMHVLLPLQRPLQALIYSHQLFLKSSCSVQDISYCSSIGTEKFPQNLRAFIWTGYSSWFGFVWWNILLIS